MLEFFLLYSNTYVFNRFQCTHRFLHSFYWYWNKNEIITAINKAWSNFIFFFLVIMNLSIYTFCVVPAVSVHIYVIYFDMVSMTQTVLFNSILISSHMRLHKYKMVRGLDRSGHFYTIIISFKQRTLNKEIVRIFKVKTFDFHSSKKYSWSKLL